MRFTLVASLVFSGLLFGVTPAWAQKPKRTVITADPRIGFQAGQDNAGSREYLFKSGHWAPVSVDVQAGDEGLRQGTLTIETTDSDDVQNTYTVAVPPLKPSEFKTIVTYVKTGSRGGEIQLRLLGGGSEVASRKSTFDCMPMDDLLFVTLGSPLIGLRRAIIKQQQVLGGAEPANARQHTDGHVALLQTVSSMPQQWFGYQSADVVILTTTNADFINELITDKARFDALKEWVLRGGQLVISAGRNHQLLPSMVPELLEAADDRKLARLKVVPGGLLVPRLNGLENYARSQQGLEAVPTKPDEAAGITLARLQIKPGKDVEVLADETDKGEKYPILVRVPYGTGQLVVAAFDLDAPPFSIWTGQNDFWQRFQEDLGATLSAQDNQFQFGMDPSRSNDLSGELVNSLQRFPEVSNISFGWVALFIFVYILVVGPLDYFFLKKVVKRLELTWITFPAVVLVVSVVAYFTAYALKGNDLLINKADVVDIDLEGQTGYGHTWFTLFSPRIQHYVIGIEPAAPSWTKPPAPEDKVSTVLLSWMGRPDDGYGGFGRSRSQSLFRRSYNYAPEATGLEGVPIQVWSVKSFGGSWVRPLDPDKPPLANDLHFEKAGAQRLVGTITNQLPVDLVDVHLICGTGPIKGGTVYSLDKPLIHDVPQRITAEGRQLTGWLTAGAPAPVLPGGTPTDVSRDRVFKRLFFYQSDPSTKQVRNVMFRHLDASWRLRLKNEVILVGRIAPRNAAAETVTSEPVSPSKLWLGGLPTPTGTRPSLQGTLNQDTYVRMFIPVQANP